MSNVTAALQHQAKLMQDQAKDMAPKDINEQEMPLFFGRSRKAKLHVVRDLAELRRIFDKHDTDQSGFIEPPEFLPLLSRLLRQPASEIDKVEVWRRWDELDRNGCGQVAFDDFQSWYCEIFHIDHNPDLSGFISEDIIPEEQRLIREVAKKVDFDLVQVEKVWKEFKRLDRDNSGQLDFEEFKVLIQSQLSPNGNVEVTPKVVEKFWIEVDTDGSGSISFEEFVTWYERFFGERDPMEAYYQKLGAGYLSSVMAGISNIQHSLHSLR